MKALAALLACVAALLPAATSNAAPRTPAPKGLSAGVHLLVDATWIQSSTGLTRVVATPARSPANPIVTSGPGYRNWQPWVTVERDPSRKQPFRLWYDAADSPSLPAHVTQLGYLESSDGVSWPTPFTALPTAQPLTFDADVIDDGPGAGSQRYKLTYYVNAEAAAAVGKQPGAYIAFSRDGLAWQPYARNPVLPNAGNDIVSAWHDTQHDRYILMLKLFRPYSWTNAEGMKKTATVRLVGLSTSTDFTAWSDPTVLFAPDARDPGLTDFYGGTIIGRQGDLDVGLLRLSRDDYVAPGAPASEFGFGATVLIWSHDGIHWQRDDQTSPLLAPDPAPDAWDHTHAWITSAIAVGDRVYLYYGGYRHGHKANRFVDRQLGLATIVRDRYAGWQAGAAGGRLITPLLMFPSGTLALNVDTAHGALGVTVIDARGRPVRGFAEGGCKAVRANKLAATLRCARAWQSLAGKPVRLRFDLPPHATLFALDLVRN